MEVKPGYKQTEVGVIPEDWAVRRLDDCMSLLTDFEANGSFEHVAQNVRVYDSENFAWYVRATDLENETSPASVRYVDASSYRFLKKTSLFGNEVLITKRGEIGKVYRFEKKTDFATLAPNLYLLKLKEQVLPEYVYAHFRYGAGNQTLKTINASTTLGALYKNDVKALPLPCPALPEQRAIAAALSDVDALLGGLDRIIAKKHDLKQAAMQQLLTGQTRLPGFNGAWEVKRLGDVGRCLRGVSYRGDVDLSTHDTPHTKRLLRSNNIQNAVVVTDEVQFVNAARVSSNQVLQQDDILICMANGSKVLVGKAGIFTLSDGHEYTFGAFMGCFRTNSTETNPVFVFYLFLTARYRDYINNLLAGSSINNLRPSSIESLEFSTPPLPEQAAIAAVLSDIDAELAALEARREKTRDLKQAMMQELLTGKTRLVKPEAAHA